MPGMKLNVHPGTETCSCNNTSMFYTFDVRSRGRETRQHGFLATSPSYSIAPAGTQPQRVRLEHWYCWRPTRVGTQTHAHTQPATTSYHATNTANTHTCVILESCFTPET